MNTINKNSINSKFWLSDYVVYNTVVCSIILIWHGEIRYDIESVLFKTRFNNVPEKDLTKWNGTTKV